MAKRSKRARRKPIPQDAVNLNGHLYVRNQGRWLTERCSEVPVVESFTFRKDRKDNNHLPFIGSFNAITGTTTRKQVFEVPEKRMRKLYWDHVSAQAS